MASAPTQRNQSLDVLRCAAILLVLGRHFPYYWLWGRIGWIGVDLFFVLSGFLISGLLFQDYKDHGRIDWKRFLIRRGFKIYPPFYVFLAAMAVFFVAARPAFLGRWMFTTVVFAQNYFQNDLPGVMGHTWSLAVEEHFYILLPALLILLIAIRRSADPFGAILPIFVGLSLVCLSLRCLTLPTGELAEMTHMRMDSLFCGVTLGYLFHFRSHWFQKLTGHYALALAFLFCLPAALLDTTSRAMQTIGLTGLFLGFAFLVAWSLDRAPKNMIFSAVYRGAARIGFYSYSIYLWHTAARGLIWHAHVPAVLLFWIYIAVAIALGIVMARLIEVPSLTLRQKWFPTTSRGALVEGDDAKAKDRPPVLSG